MMFANKRGGTDIFFLGLAVLFIVAGSTLLLQAGSEYRPENFGEGIGFRQSALLESYHHVRDINDYTRALAKSVFYDEYLQYLRDGLLVFYLYEDEYEFGCGFVGGYHAWSDGFSTCFPEQSDVLSDVLEGRLLSRFSSSWSHPVLKSAPQYDLLLSDDNTHIVARAKNDVRLPLFGSSASSVKEVSGALSQTPRGASSLVRGESSLASWSVFPEDDFRSRSQDPSHIVLHYTVSRSSESAERSLSDGPLSVHYVVGRDGAIKQMVKEEDVAYHAGCSGSICALEGMNEKSIGIEIVNMGWLVSNNNRPLTAEDFGGVCPDGYASADRVCDWSSYAAYPNDGYDGKAICKSEPKSICWQEYPEAQLDAVFNLVADIASRRGISSANIIGHEEIKAQKSDPGPLFPWSELRDFLQESQGRGSNDVDTTSTNVAPSSSSTGSSKTSSVSPSAGALWPVENTELQFCSADADRSVALLAIDGEAVFAPLDGFVSAVDESDFCDGCVRVTLRHNQFSSFFDLKSSTVSVNDSLSRGEQIGSASASGVRFSTELSSNVLSEPAVPVFPGCLYADVLLKDVSSLDDSCGDLYADGELLDFSRSNEVIAEVCSGVPIPSSSASCFSSDFSAVEGSISVQTTLNNLKKYKLLDVISEAAQEHDVPEAFLLAIITQESLGDPFARSHTGAAGIMQFTAATGAEQGLSTTACCTVSEAQAGVCRDSAVYRCFPSNDERFDPEKAIPAGADYLKQKLDRYSSYSGDLWLLFAAAEYNSGRGAISQGGAVYPGLSKGIPECTSAGTLTWNCVKNYVRPEGRTYAEKVLEHYFSWGGSASTTISCDAGSLNSVLDVKEVGSIRFRPDFSIPIPWLSTEPIVSWAERTHESVRDNLALEFGDALNTNIPSWELSYGYCDGSWDNFLYEVVENLQECQINGQKDCTCDPIPLGPDGNYELLVTGDELLLLVDTGTGYQLRARERFFELEMNKFIEEGFSDAVSNAAANSPDLVRLSELKMAFSISGGSRGPVSYSAKSVTGENVVFEHSISGIFKESFDALSGVYDGDDLRSRACLPTQQLFPLCAENTALALYYGDADSGTTDRAILRFGLGLEDISSPDSVSETQLIPLEDGSLELSFKAPSNEDLSGVLLYCSRKPFDVDRLFFGGYVPERFLMAPGEEKTLSLESCAGEELAPWSDVYVVLRSFDSGANTQSFDSCDSVALFRMSDELFAAAQGAVVPADLLLPQTCVLEDIIQGLNPLSVDEQQDAIECLQDPACHQEWGG